MHVPSAVCRKFSDSLCVEKPFCQHPNTVLSMLRKGNHPRNDCDIILFLPSTVKKAIEGTLLEQLIKCETAENIQEHVRDKEISYDNFVSFVSKLWLTEKALCFHLNKGPIIKYVVSSIISHSYLLDFNTILINQNFVLYQHNKDPNDINAFRGALLQNYFSSLLKIAGANVHLEDKQDRISCNEIYKVCICRPSTVLFFKEPVLMLYCGILLSKENNKLQDMKTNEFFRSVNEKLRSTSGKFGDDCSGISELFLQQLVFSCCSLFLLSVRHDSPVKLSSVYFPHIEECAFILYNYARICTLLEKINLLEKQGQYSPQNLADIDFSLLFSQEEWNLTWLLLDNWSSIVKSVTMQIKSCLSCDGFDRSNNETCGKIKFSSQKVYRYLHELAHKFSVYYSHIRIIPVTPSPHLAAVFFARTFLIKAVKITMDDAFNILGVTPVKSM